MIPTLKYGFMCNVPSDVIAIVIGYGHSDPSSYSR